MESTSCKIASMENVMFDTLPSIRLVPRLMTIATPKVNRNKNGSTQEAHISSRTRVSSPMANRNTSGGMSVVAVLSFLYVRSYDEKSLASAFSIASSSGD